ncbi:DNA glycosylase [Aureobasidium pullulans]|uniref:DNA glycosylase n=1 Tax=Aureobasidium pullulans TaxID=5580 RepID=A0A4S9AX32_AURPU|nr:DNA glycosylase [Aureobasidium pullulans]
MASRPEDPIAAAAKVIRIIHDNHTAASSYLHSQKVTTGANRVETKTILQCMDQDEYTDLLEDLDSSQKLSFFDKVAGMNERSYSSQLDKEAARKYFDALSLESMGLSFKDVRKEIKKAPAPITTPAAPSTPVRKPVAPSAPIAPSAAVAPSTPVATKSEPVIPKPQPVVEKKVEAKKAPAVPVSKPQKEKETKKEKKDKKRKREEDTPKAKPTLPDAKPIGGSDRASKKQKIDPPQKKTVEAPTDGLNATQRKRQRQREKKRLLMEKIAAGELQPLDKKEPEASAAPLTSSNGQADGDVDMGSPEPAPAAEIAPLDSTVPANSKTKKVRRSRHKSEKAKSKAAEPESESLPVTLSGSEELSASLQPPTTETIVPENAEVVDGNKKARRRTRKVKAGEAIDVPATAQSIPAIDEAPTLESTLASDSAPVVGSSPAVENGTEPAVDESSEDDGDEEEDEEAAPTEEDTMPDFIRRTTMPVPGKPTISTSADKEPSPEITQEHSSEESPSPTTRETSVSAAEEVASPPPQQQEIIEDKKSSPIATKTEPSKPVPSSFTSAPVQPSKRPQLSNSFSKPQSSFTSTRSGSFQSANNKKAANDSFAEFAAFASGKKLGYDSSDDDDDESSSSSSESEDEKPALVQARKPSPIQHVPYQAPPVISSSQAEPSAMDVDTEPETTQKHEDPAAPAETIDVVMTNDQQDASSPVEYHDSQPSAQDEAEGFAVQAQDDNAVTFQSFHQTATPQDAPARSPLPEIPNPEDLMEFGGYQPASPEKNDEATPAAEEEQTSEPANRETHEGPELTNSPHSIELGTPFENINNSVQELDSHPNADEQESSSEDEQASVTTQEPNNLEGEVAQAEGLSQVAGTEGPALDSDTEEPAEAFSTSMEDFLAAWEEETDNFEERIEQLRQLLEEDGDGSTEDNKDMLEKLMNEVEREEEIYKSKTAAASNAVTALPQLAREQIQEVIDRADASFEQRVMMVRSSLREEYNAESARGQLSPSRELGDDEMADAPEIKAEQNTGDQDAKVEPSEKSTSPAPSSLGCSPSEDEGITESAKKETKPKARKSRKSTGATSEHFTPSPKIKKKRVPAGVSAVAFPKLTAPRFGLIQERLANDPFRLLIAVTFLNKTTGRAAVPIYEQVMEKYPTPTDLAAADVSDLSEMIHSLGFQNQRARKLVKIAETWIEQPPQKGKLFRTRDYPNHGNGRQLKPTETVDEDVNDCAEVGALEIAHIYGTGSYAWDSWRIFCRDKFRGVAEGYNGEGVPGYNPSSQAKSESNFEPEWKRVVPLDKELRACLRWMWLREGWEWDPLTGNKKPATPTLMREASDGVATWDEPVAMNPHEEDTKTVKEELEGPKGPDALVPGVKAEDTTPPTKRTRRSRNTRAERKEVTPPPVAKVEEAATPVVPASTKRLNADPEIMTSRLRPRAGRTDAVAPAAVAATPSRRRARK